MAETLPRETGEPTDSNSGDLAADLQRIKKAQVEPGELAALLRRVADARRQMRPNKEWSMSIGLVGIRARGYII